uniref:Uncharacterized protein n=1 Tax=Potamogeton distinctus TaxID=62344 RepID=A5LGJ8_POTDI|nr:hypothetical protein [Potamogeton distinctus]
MSGLVDMWTNEVAKLREKSQEFFKRDSTPPTSHVREKQQSSVRYPVLSQALRIKKQPPVTLCSVAAVSMIVDCVSP